jgi:WD40 repeat protein
MRGGIAAAVRAGGQLRALGPTALISFLFASAFAPFLAPLLGHLPSGALEAELSAALNQFGGIGGGYVAEFLARTVERTRGEGEAGLTEEQLRKQLAGALEQVLGQASGEMRAGLRAELSDVLRQLDAVQVAMAADRDGVLAESFANLGESMAEFRWVLDDVRAMLDQVLRALDDNAAQQRSQWNVVRGSQDTVIGLMLRIESALLAGGVTGGAGADRPAAPAQAVCPYPGLLPFEGADARWFFGREELTLHLVSRVAQQEGSGRPLFVLGPSGAGKSSLLRAGLIPRLREAAGRRWSAVLLSRPGTHPLDSLSGLLPAADDGSEGRLVVVDQFEEIFTQCPDEAERLRFVRALLEMTEAVVVLGVRTDFYQDCAAIPGLGELLPDNQVLVGPLSGNDLRRAITQPATAVGHTVEPGLTELLLSDLGAARGGVGYEPGALPLLAYALRATWDLRTGTTLTVAGYREAGGIHGAVANEAERVYENLPEQAKQTTHRIMLRLVSVGPGERPVRRSVPEPDLVAGLGSAGIVLSRYTTARLITADRDSVQISHEALLGAWPRLQAWVAEDQAGLRLRHQLAEDAASWDRERRDPGGLYRGLRLASALSWRRTGDNEAGLTAVEREFLTASADAQEALRAAEQTERLRDRRQNRRLRALAVVLAVVLAAAVAAGGVALSQRQQAIGQRNLAAASDFAALSDDQQTTDPAAADLDALAGWQADHTEQSLSSLLSREANPYLASFPEPGASAAKTLAISSDGKLLAVGEEPSLDSPRGSSIQLWNVAQRKQAADFTGIGGIPQQVTFSPDGSTLAAVVLNLKGNLRFWNVTTHRPLPDPVRGRLIVTAVAYSPDGRLLAVGCNLASRGPGGRLLPEADWDGVTELWDLSTDRMIRLLPGTGGFVFSLAFSPDGRLLATGGQDEHVRLWNVATGKLQAVLSGNTGTIESVSFSPGGNFLAASSLGGTIRLWSVPGGAPYGYLSITSGGELAQVPSRAMAFSPDGDDLYVSFPGTSQIIHYDLATMTQAGSPIRLSGGAGENVSEMAFSPGGLLAVGGLNGTLATLDVGGRTFYNAGDNALNSVAVSGDGSVAATGGGDGAVQLWETSDPADSVPLSGEQGLVERVRFSPDGKSLAAVDSTCTASVWDVATGMRLVTLTTPNRYLDAPTGNSANLAFGPDGKSVITYCSSDSFQAAARDTVLVWDITGRLIATYQVPSAQAGTAGGLALSPDGRTLAIDTGTGTVIFRDMSSGRVTRAISTGQVGGSNNGQGGLALAFSPDGKLLATAGPTGTIDLWSAGTGALLRSVPAQTPQVRELVFSPDGTTLAVASQDSVVRLWRVPDLSLEAALSATPQTLTANGAELTANQVAFADNGSTLVSVNNDGTAQVWDLNPADAVRDLCAALGAPWVASQWRVRALGPGSDPCSLASASLALPLPGAAERGEIPATALPPSPSIVSEQPLNISGTWAGNLNGTSGSLSYTVALAQAGGLVNGTAKGVGGPGYVVFALTGKISGTSFTFKQVKIIKSDPEGRWCLISGVLTYSAGNRAEYLRGPWQTAGNTNPGCVGITGDLTLHRTTP